MPNVKNITKLQEIIAAQPHASLNDASGFNMRDYTHPCGTPSCIKGFCEPLMTSMGYDEDKKFLGISMRFSWELFYPGQESQKNIDWNSITPAEAVQALEYIKTGTNVNQIWAHVKESD